MKLIAFIITFSFASHLYASPEACKGYALNTDAALNSINLSYERELRVLNINLQKDLSKCTDDECIKISQNNFRDKLLNLKNLQKDQIQRYLEILSENCKDI
jgi:hypothetical protein